MGRWGLVLVSVLAFWSCDAEPEGTTTLRVANWGGAGDDGEFDRLVQSFYREFERENPGVRVRVEGIPGQYVEKMLLNFIAGTAPDVVTLDASSAAIFIDNGFLTDLTPLVKADPEFDLDAYYPNVVGIARRGERLFAIPGDFTPMVMYYNKDLFDRAGVAYPREGWTFAEFRETARRLSRGQEQYGFVFTNWMPGWVMWLWNNGGDVLSPDGKRATSVLDSPANVETVTFLRDLVRRDGSAPSLSETAAMGVDLFATGRAAMTVSGHWMIPTYKSAQDIDWRRLGVVSLPTNVGRSHTVMYEAGFAISKGAKNPELAWKFIRKWTDYRLQKEYNASGIAVSARKDVSQERMAEDALERDFAAIIPQARPPYGSWVEGYDVVEKVGREMMDRVLNGDVVPATALRDAARQIDREFAKRG
jgi:multiple sugar transport system substrate-binding protein